MCGNSDPGTSGLLSPFAKMKTLYFDDSPEPDEYYYNLMKDLTEKFKKSGKKFITCEFDNAEDFYDALMAMDKFANDNIKVSGLSREGTYDMVLHKEVDLDSDSAPSIEADAKKKKKSEKEELRKKKEEEIRREMEEEAFEEASKESE